MNMILILLIICVAELGISIGQSEPNEVCTTIDKCPSAAGQNNNYLRRKQCGRDGNKLKIWCQVPCVTPDYQNGICTSWLKCSPFRKLVAQIGTSTAEKKSYLQKFRCNTATEKSEVYVCCAEQTIEEENGGGANQELCGYQSDQVKIIGGNVAQLGQFPWMARLQYNDKGKLGFKCGGTIINRRYVLTAAHCLNSSGEKLVNVFLGVHDVTKEKYCVGEYCSVVQIIPVENTIQHPGWLNAQTRFLHDLAVIRLSKDAEYSEFVHPICLPPKEYTTQLHEDYTVAGWDLTEISASSNVKHFAKILLQEKKLCLNTIAIPLVEGQMCLGGGSVDTCKGDSGGPLMKSKQVDRREVWSIIGIVSFGFNRPCGTLKRPGIYTYVPYYIDWIKENSRYYL